MMMPESNGRTPHAPRRVNIEVTSKCNLRCSYCSFFGSTAARGPDLQTDEWLSFFEELGRLAVMEVTLSGGEPFARKDLNYLLNAIVKNRMRFNILSNGALISDDIAAYIANTGRCNSVQISLDGSQEEIHDSARGVGAFEGAVRGLIILSRYKIKRIVRFTIHRNNVQDLDATARWALDDLGIETFGTNAASYLGSCRNHSNDLQLSVADRGRAMAVMAELERDYPGRISSSAGPGAEVSIWGRMLNARKTNAAPSDIGGRLTACGCPTVELSVLSDGTVVPCYQLPHLGMGRINRDALSGLWSASPEIRALRDRKTIPLSQFEECSHCEFVNWCTGSCPATAYTLTGEINRPSPDSCLRRFLTDGGQIPTENDCRKL